MHMTTYVYPIKTVPYEDAPLSTTPYGYIRYNSFNESWTYFNDPETENDSEGRFDHHMTTLTNGRQAFAQDGQLFPLRKHRQLNSGPAVSSTGYIGGDNSSLRYIDNGQEQLNKVVFADDHITYLADEYGYLREFRSGTSKTDPYVKFSGSAGLVIDNKPPFGYVLYRNMELGKIGKTYELENSRRYYVYSENGDATAVMLEPSSEAPYVTSAAQDGFILWNHNGTKEYRLFDSATQSPGLNDGAAVRDIGNYRYEFDPEGYVLSKTLLLRNQWADYAGKVVYFDQFGTIATNQWIDGFYVTEDGSRAVGLRTIDNNTYYFNPETNHKTTGWQLIDGKWFLFSAAGHMLTGWQQLNNTWFFLEDNGVMATGWKQINGKRYFLEAGGQMAKGWKQVDGTWFFLEESGAMAKGWKLINGTWFFLEESGAMAKGWKLINGTWFFLEESGAMAKGWKLINGTWFFLEESGAMAKGWKLINGTWYYLSESGAMLTGTHTIKNVRYTFNNSGALIATGQ